MDLYHFPQRGLAQAGMLAKILKSKGKNLGFEE
jgi:hypothetical protein